MIARTGVALLGTLLMISAGARAADPPPHQTCVDVTVGSAQSYDCLNQARAAQAGLPHRPSSATDAPVSATSPSNVTGQFNESATRNRLGSNFGHSVTPQRPVYNPPVAGTRPH